MCDGGGAGLTRRLNLTRLQARSQYFKSLLMGGMREDGAQEVELQSWSDEDTGQLAAVFRGMLQYLYDDVLPAECTTIGAILPYFRAARFFGLSVRALLPWPATVDCPRAPPRFLPMPSFPWHPAPPVSSNLEALALPQPPPYLLGPDHRSPAPSLPRA